MTMFAGLFGSSNAKATADSQKARKAGATPPRPGDEHKPSSSPLRRLSSSNTRPSNLLPSRPPFPHPLPHKVLNVLHTNEGIVLYPAPSATKPSSNATATFQGRAALVPWGKSGKVEVLEECKQIGSSRKKSQCTAYGVVGVLKLFQETYLLLLSSKRNVGAYLDSPTKSVHCLKGILAIPLSTSTEAEKLIRQHAESQAVAERQRSPKRKTIQLNDVSDSGSTTATTATTDESGTSGDESTDDSRSASAGEMKVSSPGLHEKGENEKGPPSLALAEDDAAVAKVGDAIQEEKGHKHNKKSASFGLGRFFWSGSSQDGAADSDPSKLISMAGAATTPVPENTDPLEKAGAGVGRAEDNAKSASILIHAEETQQEQPDVSQLKELDKKILKEALAEMTSGAMFFSHDFDLTRCVQHRYEQIKEDKIAASRSPRHAKSADLDRKGQIMSIGKEDSKRWVPGKDRKDRPSLRGDRDSTYGRSNDVDIDLRREEPSMITPLSQRADKRFWWNNWLSRPFTDAGLFEYITVLMQGYAQQETVEVDLKPVSPLVPTDNSTPTEIVPQAPLKVTLMVISRRSVERPGLRYQRRGINDSGGVANFVESEFLVTTELEGNHHVSSYVQTRGSIPLFWSQSPWSLKPVPLLERTDEENLAAIGRHFEKMTKNYFGKNVIINLAEQIGKEGMVVKAYKDKVEQLGRKEVIYNEWDFHHICKGMKYENISLLLDELATTISDIGSFWNMESENFNLQRGVFRTNCMDCLDRTNVVQSAIARNQLSTFLVNLGVSDVDAASQERLEVAFNGIWANNGDAISREYAGTSALKGDFVRSGKRNWRGQFNDATNSIARYWQNTVLDFFKQSMIDYVLGINTNSFVEFSERMQTSDPGEIMRLATIRKAAVEASVAHCLSEGEICLQGWTLLAPVESGQIRATQYEERILLLTARAVYCCSFEYTLQKVRDFTRIPLGQVTGLQKGEYILSALDSSARNVEENFGLIIRYMPEGTDSRSRSYSIRNKPAISPTSDTASPSSEAAPADQIAKAEEPCLLAFKAMRTNLIRDLDSVSSETSQSSRVQVNLIAEYIRSACEDIGATTEEEAETFVTEEPIISLAEATSKVGILDRLNHELKNLIWL